MKHKRKLIHTLLGFSILLQAAFFQIAMPNLVLCIAGDGHVAIEWRAQSESCQHKDRTVPDIFVHNEKEHSTASGVECTDISLHFHPSHAEMIQNNNITQLTVKIFDRFEFWDQKVIDNPVPSIILQILPSNLNIGTDQSTILII